jgi:hypothetical protein
MSRTLDNAEVATSMVSGAVINYLLTMLIFGVSHTFALGTTALFFCVSYLRSYIIRRIFRKIGERNE